MEMKSFMMPTHAYGGEPSDIPATVDVICATCDGIGYVERESFPDRDKVRVICMECMGEGHYEEDEYIE